MADCMKHHREQMVDAVLSSYLGQLAALGGSMVAPGLMDGARWVLVFAFALAATEKADALRKHRAPWHPVMLASSRRRQQAGTLMFGSLVLDLTIVVLLVATARLGALVSVFAIVTYTWAAIPMHSHGGVSECGCFFKLLATRTKAGLVARNSLMLLLSGIVAIGEPVGSWLGAVSGVAILAALMVSTYLFDRLEKDPGEAFAGVQAPKQSWTSSERIGG